MAIGIQTLFHVQSMMVFRAVPYLMHVMGHFLIGLHSLMITPPQVGAVLLSTAFGDPNTDGCGWVVFGDANEKQCGH